MSGFVFPRARFHSSEGPTMLTSPVNVTIAASNGLALKSNTAASDHGARREPPLLPHHQAQNADMAIEPELPSNSLLTNVNAVTATVGNRTVLQEFTLNVATMLRIARRQDENLTSLFLRIIATIEAMPQAERLQFEIRAGLKPLRITLSDLIMALRKPDGQEAARLTALAEAPNTMPGRTAANAATTTYLEEGTDSGHTEETLAMRTAARHSAAGQSVFSAESKVRPADARPADAKVLQNQLKVMFEPGEAPPAETLEEPAGTNDVDTGTTARNSTISHLRQAMPGSAGESVVFSSANLKLDPPTVEKIRNVAQAIANHGPDAARSDPERPTAEKSEDRRLQTMLTLKGFAEAVTAIPAKAAELLAVVVAEAMAPLPDRADESEEIVEGRLETPGREQPPELKPASGEAGIDDAGGLAPAEEVASEADMPAKPELSEMPGEAAMTDENQAAADAHGTVIARPDLTGHAVPFAYAPVQPAREEVILAVEEEETREGTDEDAEDDGDEDSKRRRPRDEYDAIHDPLPEEEPAIVINRDSSESDRAFALYQRMGGF